MTWRMVEVRERTNHSFTGEKPPEQTDIQEAIQAGTPLRGVLPLINNPRRKQRGIQRKK